MSDCQVLTALQLLTIHRFEARKNTMIVFLYRPSPQIPQPSLRAAQLAYDASVFNLPLAKDQIIKKTVDLTWIFTQSIFMALNTVLWALSYPEIRQQHPVQEVKQHIDIALESINLCSFRWPGVSSALELYKHLVQACLKAYDSDKSFVLQSPARSPPSSQDLPTPSSQFSDMSPSQGILPPSSQGGYTDSVPPASSIPPLTPSASNTSIHSTTPTSVTSMPFSYPLTKPTANTSNPSGQPFSTSTSTSYSDFDPHLHPSFQPATSVPQLTQPQTVPQIPLNSLSIPQHSHYANTVSSGSSLPDYTPTSSISQEPQHYIPKPSGPASAPLIDDPVPFHRGFPPTPQIYSPGAEYLALAPFDPQSMYPFKDFAESSPYEAAGPFGPTTTINGLSKHTWTNPFNQMSFDMFTIPTESPGHRSSSLSQEQQSEMMAEIEQGLEQGELPDLGAKRMSLVAESQTSYNDAVL